MMRYLKSDIGRRIGLLIGQFLALVLCISYIELTYFHHIVPDKYVEATFKPVDCVVMSKKLSVRGRFFHRYRAEFLINYNVESVQYTHWVFGNGLDPSFVSDEQAQEDRLAQYQIGQTYRCFYNPENPEVSLLVLRHNWRATFPLIIPALILLVIGYYFFANGLKILKSLRAKTKNKKTKEKRRKK